MSTAEEERARPVVPEPEVRDEHRERAARIAESYDEDRPTTILPGSGGTVAGTAVNDWVDENGDPIYGRDEPGSPDRD